MNLKKMNLVELNAQENKSTEGGWIFLAIRTVAACVALCNTDWDQAGSDIARGANSVKI
jgi:hypothetical protein